MLSRSEITCPSTLLATVFFSSLLTWGVHAEAAQLEKVVADIEKPITVTSPPGDAREFFIEQEGRIRIIDASGQVLATPFLDITSLVEWDGLFQGLLGLAFHPDYASNGYFFVDYLVAGGDTRISRFEVSSDPNVADPGSESVVITIDQPGTDHNGGYIAFGPQDGYLYVSMGDGGFGGSHHENGQDTNVLLGKILRLDVDVSSGYQIPPDNPFVGVPGYREEIWAFGLRSPWGMSFDRETHDLWIADVGLNSWEELNFQPAASTGGENYGWSRMEGNHCYQPPSDCDDGSMIHPIYEYPHGPLCSINGGFVYRGSAIPEYQGLYFFSDWCTSQIWTIEYDGNEVTELVNRTAELAPPGGESFSFLSGFGQDADGELYVIDWNWTNPNSGQIYKIVPDAADAPLDTEATSAGSGLELRFAQPNPFQSHTRIQLTAAPGTSVDLSIHSPSGRLVWSERIERSDSELHWIEWDGRDATGTRLPSGTYFLKAQSGETVRSQRIHIVR